MKKGFIKNVVKFSLSLALIMSILLTTACGDSKETVIETPAPTPTVSPEPTMQDILNSLGEVEFTDAKHVILFIGDGMGENHILNT